ncbi:DUF5819 family protein [Microbacterium sp. F51-2R]|uniref:DUF5819 family protein n=1 Tax=Microbacterium sp. F51-2R TaxID=3445777 RepID=UPI003F9F8FF7
MFVTLLFVSPPNPVKTAFAAVTGAASPYFAQKWNVFAPNISKSNPEFLVQAQWRDSGGHLVKSRWLNITQVEFASVTGSALPSRVQKLSWNALTAYLTRFRQLTGEQRAAVQDTFIERFEGGYRGTPPHTLVDRLSARRSSGSGGRCHASDRTISTDASTTPRSTRRPRRASGGGKQMTASAPMRSPPSHH